jgi:predicted transcriptional regulator
MNVAVSVTRPSEIAPNLGFSRQAVGQTLAEMEARGILVTSDDPAGRRARQAGFAAGSATITDAVAILTSIEERLADWVGREYLRGLRKAPGVEWVEIPSTG